VRVAELARRDRIAIAVAAAVALAMYGGSIWTVITTGGRRPLGLDMISAAIAAPLVEEWVFRGLLWNQLAAATSGWRGAEVIALLGGRASTRRAATPRSAWSSA
jgi:hypothetical protein